MPGFKVRARTRSVLVPQSLIAFTVILPPVVPEVAVMELVVLVPVHPLGKVQMYEVAPVTPVIE